MLRLLQIRTCCLVETAYPPSEVRPSERKNADISKRSIGGDKVDPKAKNNTSTLKRTVEICVQRKPRAKSHNATQESIPTRGRPALKSDERIARRSPMLRGANVQKNGLMEKTEMLERGQTRGQATEDWLVLLGVKESHSVRKTTTTQVSGSWLMSELAE